MDEENLNRERSRVGDLLEYDEGDSGKVAFFDVRFVQELIDSYDNSKYEDPFMPTDGDWIRAGKLAKWHCVNADGWASWLNDMPTPTGDSWFAEGSDREWTYTQYDLNGLDWRNSLRHRPQGI